MAIIQKKWGLIKPPLGSRHNIAHPLSQGLVSHWLMNEGSGSNTLYDCSGRSVNGVFTGGGPTWTTGLNGSGLSFVPNQYVLFSGQTIMMNDAFSIVVWYKSTATTSTTLYSNAHSVTSTFYGTLHISENIAGDVVFWLTDTGSVTAELNVTGLASNDGRWHCITVVQYSKSSRELFFDAVSIDTDTTTIGACTYTNSALGVTIRPTPVAYLTGTLNDARIYNRALTSGEVDWLYAEPFADIVSPFIITAKYGQASLIGGIIQPTTNPGMVGRSYVGVYG